MLLITIINVSSVITILNRYKLCGSKKYTVSQITVIYKNS
jgi:hypothetical protein